MSLEEGKARVIHLIAVDHPCISSAWEQTSGRQSERERDEEQEKRGAEQENLLNAAHGTQLAPRLPDEAVQPSDDAVPLSTFEVKTQAGLDQQRTKSLR